MSTERTLSMIKPDAVKNNHIGEIYHRFERNGLTVVAAKMLHLTRERAGEFYAVHEGRPFYDELVEFMSSGPIMVQVLEGESVVDQHRLLMGATNPAEAAPGTLRAEFAESIGNNAVHGSDALETAVEEISFFFNDDEIVDRS